MVFFSGKIYIADKNFTRPPSRQISSLSLICEDNVMIRQYRLEGPRKGKGVKSQSLKLLGVGGQFCALLLLPTFPINVLDTFRAWRD